MAKQSKISWTDSTHNFWYGCRKISPECAYCYAERWANASGKDFAKITKIKDFDAPLRWKEPRTIFTCSLSDFFIEEADPWRDEAWEVIRKASWHTWLILTKRIERAHFHTPWITPGFKGMEPWPHVLLGISAGNQRMLDLRAPELFKLPAAGYFVSAEPLLGPLDFHFRSDGGVMCLNCCWGDRCDNPNHVDRNRCTECQRTGAIGRLNAVIVGGESGGPEYRRLVEFRRDRCVSGDVTPLHWKPKLQAIQWVCSIRDQCEQAGIKFIFKQFGGPRPESGGRTLDGKVYDGYPT